MILCVHRILTYNDVEEDGAALVLELTDGWYLIRAEIDAPMRRAVRRGALRVGQKVGIIGAKVCKPAAYENSCARLENHRLC